jgi:N-acetyl-anhydromuramyl-L-alanine amidase AmpD
MTPAEIIVHHSAGEDGAAADTAAIRKYHTQTLGFLDVGYHALVERVGLEYEALLGRPWTMIGAHALGHNDRALGICFVGNTDVYELPRRQLEIGARVIRLWQEIYNIPRTAVLRHSDVADTACPGQKFPWADLLAILLE